MCPWDISRNQTRRFKTTEPGPNIVIFLIPHESSDEDQQAKCCSEKKS